MRSSGRTKKATQKFSADIYELTPSPAAVTKSVDSVANGRRGKKEAAKEKKEEKVVAESATPGRGRTKKADERVEVLGPRDSRDNDSDELEVKKRGKKRKSVDSAKVGVTFFCPPPVPLPIHLFLKNNSNSTIDIITAASLLSTLAPSSLLASGHLLSAGAKPRRPPSPW